MRDKENKFSQVKFGQNLKLFVNRKQAGFAVPHSSLTIGWVGVGLELGWGWVGVGLGLGGGWDD